jgi:hypothetical protein
MQPSAPDTTLLDPMALKAERCYNAFLKSMDAFLPPVVQSWRDLHPRLRQAWIAVAAAALEA